MNQTAPNNSPVTDEQLEKWKEQGRALVERNGLDSKGFNDFMFSPHFGGQQDLLVRRILRKAAQKSSPVAVTQLSDSQREAKAIMGANFFGIEEATTHFGAKWNQEQLDALATVPFSDEVLEACKDTHILVAGYPMTLLQVRAKASKAKKGKLFYSTEGSWYESQAFARKTKVEVRWYLIRKKPIDNSTNKSWDEQQALLKNESTPTACVMVYTIMGHFLNTGERLFENVNVRCSDIDSDGYHVNVGNFDAGSHINWLLGGSRRSDLGLSASRNF